MTMRLDVPVTRRTLLRTSAMSAALLAMSRLRVAPAAARASGAELRVLTPGDARIFSAIAERMTFTGDPALPRFGDTNAMASVDAALIQLPPDIPHQLSWALMAFEYGPPVFVGKLSSYTGLTPEWQDAYLAGWAESRFATCRLAFQAFKNLSMLGYYSQDAVWPAIHYQGPWAPKPRRLLPPA
jgi:hypothetical protein